MLSTTITPNSTTRRTLAEVNANSPTYTGVHTLHGRQAWLEQGVVACMLLHWALFHVMQVPCADRQVPGGFKSNCCSDQMLAYTPQYVAESVPKDTLKATCALSPREGLAGSSGGLLSDQDLVFDPRCRRDLG